MAAAHARKAKAGPIKAYAARLVEARWFEPFMIGLIIFNAILIGLETSKEFVARYDGWLSVGNDIILGVFIIEAMLKITAVAPRWRLYFGDGWNLFDFSIIVFSLIPATDD